ncbi:MAG: hypothetical protein KJ971_08755 [Firmicutes bacterium]|nr:hypothetical protein [Bacillota bacterium]
MKLILPLFVEIPRKKSPNKRFYLGLNPYRNTHFQILNQAKEAYKGLVSDAYFYYCNLPGNKLLPPPPYLFQYTVFPGSARKFDLANILSIVQKFTDDSLIDLGVIPDDSYKIIRSIEYHFGAVDKTSPRVELEISSPFEGRIKHVDVPKEGTRMPREIVPEVA